MIIKSNYRESEKNQFYMEVVREDDEFYYVRLLPEYQDKFQEGNKVDPLRKCLVGNKDNLYSIVDELIQMSIFEF